MAEDRINSIIDIQAIQKEVDATKSSVQQVIDLIKAVKGTAISISGATTMSEFNNLNKQLQDQITSTNKAAAATKTLTLEQAKLNEQTKVTNAATRAQAKEALGLNDAYAKLVIRFAAASKEAKNVAVQYGVNSKQAQAAAKEALGLNNQLKAIDESIGNHQREVGNYGKALEGAGEKIKHFGLEILSLIGIFSVTSFLSDSIDQFLELDKTMRILQNTLKNVGAPELFGRIEERTKQLTEKFKFLKNEDVASVFNKLIVYGKLTENQINDLVPVIINFASATGQSLPESAALLIKAMEGNGRALKEFGINMKDAKTPAEGLSLIMKELAPRVDGVAEAFGESAAGKIAATKEEFVRLKEELGSGLLPIINKVLGAFNDLVIGATGAAKAIKSAFSGGSFIGSIVEDSFRFDENAQKAVQNEVKANKSFLSDMIKQLDDLHAQGKKLDKTEIDIKKEFLNSLVQNNLARASTFEQIKKTGNVQDIKNVLVSLNATKQTIDELQAELFGNKVLGPPGSDKKEPKDDSKERQRILEANARAEFEIFKLQQERLIDLDKETIDNQKASYADRLLALNDYAIRRQAIIDETARFELTNTKLTASEIKLIEEKRIDASLRLAHELALGIQKATKDFKDATKPMSIAVDGMAKSIEKSIEGIQKKNKELKEGLEKNQKDIKEATNKLISELQGLVFDLFTADIDRQKNAIQDRIDLLDKQKQKEIEVANQTITNAQDKAAAISVIEARAAAQKEQLQKKQRELDERKAKFDRAEAVINIIANTARGITAALASVPPNPVLAAIVGAIGAVQLARTLAQPIPKFGQGGLHKGGLMEVGDAGRSEGIILPDGSVLKSPSRSIIMDAPAGTRIFPDFEKMMLSATITKVPEFKVRTFSDGTKEAINKIGKDIVRAIKNQPQTIFRPEPRWRKFMKQGSNYKDYIN